MTTNNSFVKNIRTKFSGGGEKLLQVSHYTANNSPALLISDLNGEPLLTASVCLDIAPKPGNIIIKDWSENEGICQALISANLISETITYHPTGFVVATEHTMTNELKEAWEAHRKDVRLGHQEAHPNG